MVLGGSVDGMILQIDSEYRRRACRVFSANERRRSIHQRWFLSNAFLFYSGRSQCRKEMESESQGLFSA